MKIVSRAGCALCSSSISVAGSGVSVGQCFNYCNAYSTLFLVVSLPRLLLAKFFNYFALTSSRQPHRFSLYKVQICAKTNINRVLVGPHLILGVSGSAWSAGRTGLIEFQLFGFKLGCNCHVAY